MNTKLRVAIVGLSFLVASALVQAQSKATTNVNATHGEKVVVITGARFSYKLIEKWIDEYNKTNPTVQIIVEARGSNDPLKYDILAEVYEHAAEFKAKREYINVGRYAVFPVASSASAFAKTYSNEGLTRQHIVQIFFHNLFADKEKEKSIKAPYTVYTRLQKAGVPVVFSKYFGFEQKDLKGNGIAGADSHLVKALLKDSTGVSYLPTALIYGNDGKPLSGLSVIPVDINGNNKITDDEKFVGDFAQVTVKLENGDPSQIKNIPIDYLHLSIDKQNATIEAIDFLKWVNENGQQYLHEFGFLLPESKRFEKETFADFASKKGR